jgi:glycosyltransferase involved in cell wall biosynthesis
LQKNNILKIGFIGELSQRKGIHILLKAMALVNRKCEVIIAGSGDEEYKKELLALSKKCKHKVYFLDYVNNMSLVYPYLDIVVLPSLNFESFGMTIIEAMKYKKPVICSDFGGMKEVLEHNITGLVVLANNVFLLKKAIELLINNEEMRISMGLAGRQRLESNFNSARMVGHYEGLFF